MLFLNSSNFNCRSWKTWTNGALTFSTWLGTRTIGLSRASCMPYSRWGSQSKYWLSRSTALYSLYLWLFLWQVSSHFWISTYSCPHPFYYIGKRPTKDLQNLIWHLCNLHDDFRRPLPFWCGLSQQPACCWRGPVNPCSPFYTSIGCE